MKQYHFMAAVTLMCLTTACEVKTSSVGDGLLPPGNQKPWPAYADQALSGKVFGQDWKAMTAVVRPFGGDTTKVSVEFVAERRTDLCDANRTPSQTSASVVIPADYKAQEYIGDIMTGEGNPLTFSTFVGGAKTIIADKTKLRVSDLTATGFTAAVYASGQDETGAVSEINGKIAVMDCRKVANFAVWKELAGWYRLKTFDGSPVKERYAIVELNTATFYDRSTSRYVKTYMFPLYASVSENSDSTYAFGPMEGLGVSQVVEANGVKTYTYNFAGPINMRGKDINVKFSMTAVKMAQGMTISYSIEIPEFKEKSTHTLTVQ